MSYTPRANTAGRVWQELRKEADWISGPELAARLGLIPSDTLQPLNRMLAEGMVERQKIGKCWFWRLLENTGTNGSEWPAR